MAERSSTPVVPGFRFGAVAAGIKKSGELDLGLIASDEPSPVAAMLTRNRVRAAPVELVAARIERGRAQAVLVNSGNANACTGKQGLKDATRTTDAVARALGVESDLVLPASTGVIGQPLPVDRIERAVPDLVASLDPKGASDFAEAIRTTDRYPKLAAQTLRFGRGMDCTVLGVAKGAGMIHPDMATTLAFVVTDARLHSAFLRKALREATERTFNRLSVDGDTSTNDVIIVISSGRVAMEPLRATERSGRQFIDGLADVLGELGRMIVADGEGSEHVVRIEVKGAPTDSGALRVARTIATSSLVKTALHGKDPNWGRILAAAGRAGVRFEPTKVEIRVGDVPIVRRGVGLGEEAESQARRVMRAPEYTISVRLGAGAGEAHMLTCDLGHEYIRINADYRS